MLDDRHAANRKNSDEIPDPYGEIYVWLLEDFLNDFAYLDGDENSAHFDDADDGDDAVSGDDGGGGDGEDLEI